jgi:hypothetical protein
MTGRVLSHVRQRRREWIVPLLQVLEGAQEQSLPRKVRETGSRRLAREVRLLDPARRSSANQTADQGEEHGHQAPE